MASFSFTLPPSAVNRLAPPRVYPWPWCATPCLSTAGPSQPLGFTRTVSAQNSTNSGARECRPNPPPRAQNGHSVPFGIGPPGCSDADPKGHRSCLGQDLLPQPLPISETGASILAHGLPFEHRRFHATPAAGNNHWQSTLPTADRRQLPTVGVSTSPCAVAAQPVDVTLGRSDRSLDDPNFRAKLLQDVRIQTRMMALPNEAPSPMAFTANNSCVGPHAQYSRQQPSRPPVPSWHYNASCASHSRRSCVPVQGGDEHSWMRHGNILNRTPCDPNNHDHLRCDPRLPLLRGLRSRHEQLRQDPRWQLEQNTRSNIYNDRTTMTLPPPHSSHASRPLHSLSMLSLPSTSVFHPSPTSRSSRILSVSRKPLSVSLPVHTGESTRQEFIQHAEDGSVWFKIRSVAQGAPKSGPRENIFITVPGVSGTAQRLSAFSPQFLGDCFSVDCGSQTILGHSVVFDRVRPRLVCSDGTVLPLMLDKDGFYMEVRLNTKGQPF